MSGAFVAANTPGVVYLGPVNPVPDWTTYAAPASIPVHAVGDPDPARPDGVAMQQGEG